MFVCVSVSLCVFFNFWMPSETFRNFRCCFYHCEELQHTSNRELDRTTPKSFHWKLKNKKILLILLSLIQSRFDSDWKLFVPFKTNRKLKLLSSSVGVLSVLGDTCDSIGLVIFPLILLNKITTISSGFVSISWFQLSICQFHNHFRQEKNRMIHSGKMRTTCK